MFRTKKMDKEYIINKFEKYMMEYQYKAAYYGQMAELEPRAILRHEYMKLYLRYNQLADEMCSELRRFGATVVYAGEHQGWRCKGRLA